MSQFKFRDTWTDFMINNVSAQGKNLELKLNLKVKKIWKDCSRKFLRNKCHCTMFLFSIFKTLWNTSYRMFWENSQQQNTVTYIFKKLHLTCLTVFWIQLECCIFTVIVNWGCHIEFFKILCNVISILFKCAKKKFTF